MLACLTLTEREKIPGDRSFFSIQKFQFKKKSKIENRKVQGDKATCWFRPYFALWEDRRIAQFENKVENKRVFISGRPSRSECVESLWFVCRVLECWHWRVGVTIVNVLDVTDVFDIHVL